MLLVSLSQPKHRHSFSCSYNLNKDTNDDRLTAVERPSGRVIRYARSRGKDGIALPYLHSQVDASHTRLQRLHIHFLTRSNTEMMMIGRDTGHSSIRFTRQMPLQCRRDV